jgi:hypothetical protein
MWTGRTNTASVTIGALGTIRKGLKQNLQLLPGHPSAKELQITLMSAAYSIAKCWGKSLSSAVEMWTYQKIAT